MVPVADILNHIAKNNAEMRFTPEELLICSTKAIKHGEEVFNTYGEHSNTDLLHMYGFVEEYPQNVFDNVEILSDYLLRTIKDLKISPEDLLQKKIEIFYELDLIGKSSFIINEDGILNEEEMLQLLQIYTMTRGEVEDFVETDYELEEDYENEDYSLVKDKLKTIPLDWKNLIVDTCEYQLKALEADINEEYKEGLIEHDRLLKVKSLKNGHIRIIKKFLSHFF
jgi:N-lysine methyltransferase SETD6